jgi:hypothetical protein
MPLLIKKVISTFLTCISEYMYVTLLTMLYICIYVLNILFRLKALFTCKSKIFLLIIGVILSVFLRLVKHMQRF